MHGLLTLDIATNTGWAYASADTLSHWPQTALEWMSASGVKAAQATRCGSYNSKQLLDGATFLKYHDWLCGMVAMMRPKLVVFEAALPQSQKSAAVARRIWGLCAVTEMVCVRHGCDVMEQHLSTVRSHFLAGQRGTGRKSQDIKAAVMGECLRRGFDPKDTDQSDALAVMDYTAVVLRKRFERAAA